MDKIAVHAILWQHGKWIDSRKFVSLVAKTRNVKDRQAHYLIEKACKSSDPKEKIQKHIFPDGSVYYGLPEEFGLPTPTVQIIQQPISSQNSEANTQDYVDEEMKVQEAIIEYIKISPQLQQRKRSLSNSDIDQINDMAAVRIGRSPEEMEPFVRKIVKKNFEAQLRLFVQNARKLELEEKRARCEQFKRTHS